MARWSNVMASRSVIPVLGRRFNPNVPPAVNIEITTDCNYGCPFCPQSTRRRPSMEMTDEAFRHLVEGLRRIRFSGQIVLAVNNEPFLHPLLPCFAERVSSLLPEAHCLIITNGSLIREEHIRFFAGLEKPPLFQINDYTNDHTIARRIRDMLSAAGGEKSLGMTIHLRSATEKLSNRAGNQPGEFYPEDFRDIACTWPFVGLFVRPDLKSFLCCSDYQHTVITGDMASQELMAIWTGDIYRDVREKMLRSGRSELPLCRRCDAEWFGLPEHCCD